MIDSNNLNIGDLYYHPHEKHILNNWFFSAKTIKEKLGVLSSKKPFMVLEKKEINKDTVYIKILSIDGVIGWIISDYSSLSSYQS